MSSTTGGDSNCKDWQSQCSASKVGSSPLLPPSLLIYPVAVVTVMTVNWLGTLSILSHFTQTHRVCVCVHIVTFTDKGSGRIKELINWPLRRRFGFGYRTQNIGARFNQKASSLGTSFLGSRKAPCKQAYPATTPVHHSNHQHSPRTLGAVVAHVPWWLPTTL